MYRAGRILRGISYNRISVPTTTALKSLSLKYVPSPRLHWNKVRFSREVCSSQNVFSTTLGKSTVADHTICTRGMTTFYKSICPEPEWPELKALPSDSEPVDISKLIQITHSYGIVVGPKGDQNVIRLAQLFCEDNSEAIELTAETWRETLYRRLKTGRRMGFWTHDSSFLKDSFFYKHVLPCFHIKVILLDTDPSSTLPSSPVMQDPFLGGRRAPDDLLVKGAEVADHRVTVSPLDDPMSWFMAINTHETFVEHTQSTRGLPNTADCVGEPGQRFTPEDPILPIHSKPVPNLQNKKTVWSLAQSMLNGLAPDGGVFMPNYIKLHSVSYLRHIRMTYSERLARLFDVQQINMRTNAIDRLVEQTLKPFRNLPSIGHCGMNSALEPCALRPYVRPTSLTSGTVDKTTMKSTEQDCYNTSSSSTLVLELFHGPTGTQGDVSSRLLVNYLSDHVFSERVADKIFLTKPQRPMTLALSTPSDTEPPTYGISKGVVVDRGSHVTFTIDGRIRRETSNTLPATFCNIVVASSDEIALTSIQALAEKELAVPTLVLLPFGLLSPLQKLHLIAVAAVVNGNSQLQHAKPLVRIFEIQGSLEFVHAVQRRLLQDDPKELLERGYASLALDDTSPMVLYASLSYYLSAYADLMRLGRVPVLDPVDIPVRGIDAYLTPRSLYELDVNLSKSKPDYPKPVPHDPNTLSDVMVAANVPCGGPADVAIHVSHLPLLSGALYASAYNLPIRTIIIACDDTSIGKKLHAFFTDGIIPTFTLQDLADEKTNSGEAVEIENARKTASAESLLKLSLLAPAIERILMLITSGDSSRIRAILTRMFNEIHVRESSLSKYVVPDSLSSISQQAEGSSGLRTYSLPSIPLHGPRLDHPSLQAMRNIIRSAVVTLEEVAVTIRMDLEKANRLLTPEDAACKVAADKVRIAILRAKSQKSQKTTEKGANKDSVAKNNESIEDSDFTSSEIEEIEQAAIEAQQRVIKSYEEKIDKLIERMKKTASASKKKLSMIASSALEGKINMLRASMEEERAKAVAQAEDSARIYKRVEIVEKKRKGKNDPKSDSSDSQFISGADLANGDHDVPVILVFPSHPVRSHDRISQLLSNAPSIKEKPSEAELKEAFASTAARDAEIQDTIKSPEIEMLKTESQTELDQGSNVLELGLNHCWDPMQLAKSVQKDLRLLFSHQAKNSSSNALPTMHPELANLVDTLQETAEDIIESPSFRPLVYRFPGNMSSVWRSSRQEEVAKKSMQLNSFVEEIPSVNSVEDIASHAKQFFVDFWKDRK